MPLDVHCLEEFEPEILALMRAQLSAPVRLTTGPQLSAATELVVTSALTRDQISACPALRTVVIPFTGVPEPLRAVVAEHPPLSLHNSRWPTIPTAEGALTLLLAAAKFVLPADRAFRQHNWEMRYQPSPSILLAGRTVLVLGFGAIGQLVGRMCHGLGMRVIGVRRRAGGSVDFPAEIHPVSALPALLPRANVLIVTLPLTAETRGLVGAAELQALAKPAFLVNVGRGAVVQEAALYEALRDGTLTAAGLDVWYNYPTDAASRAHTPPAQYPFHELANVVLSPHRIDLVREHNARLAAELADTLNTAARGEPLPNRVDLAAGY